MNIFYGYDDNRIDMLIPNNNIESIEDFEITSKTKNEMQTFQQKLGEMGYKFQFITLAGFHVQNYSVFKFAQSYKKDGMAAYSKIQQQEFEAEKEGYTAVKHQREVGTTYFDTIAQIISSGKTSTTAMSGSTESEQF